MTLLQILAAALMHGLFEALPSATDSIDLLFFSFLSGRADGWALLVAVWLGLCGAILLVNGRLLCAMGIGVVRRAKGRRDPAASVLFHAALTSLVPVLVFLLWWKLGGLSLSPAWILALGLGGGLLLLLADHLGVTVRRLEHLSIADSLILGATAALGLIPGLGRIGPVLLAGRLLGYERPDLLRLSWLALVPLLLVQAGLMMEQIMQQAQLIFSFDLFLAWLVSLISALAAFAFTLRWCAHRSMTLFILLRLGLGLAAVLALWLLPV